jgi:hypothetical protein
MRLEKERENKEKPLLRKGFRLWRLGARAPGLNAARGIPVNKLC